MNRCKKV